MEMSLKQTNQLVPQVDQRKKVLVVMGATGTGKSRLSIDLATRFSGEIINSDKMQVYRGLNITTNKITDEERCGVPHHLLGVIDPESDFSIANFCIMASDSLKCILSRDHLPIIVGGSNSFIEAMVDMNFQSKYDCCFLWLDVDMPVLDSFVSERVNKMVEKGMVDEVREFYNPNGDYSRGIRRAIGVPEFHKYFHVESLCDEDTRAHILEEAINSIKVNTSQLARRQLEKINRLRDLKGWSMHRIDATNVFKKLEIGGDADTDIEWENTVAGPAILIVGRFLYNREIESKTTVCELVNRTITTSY